MLYLVPTPIGNLEDITLRALNVLKNVDIILAEDTRTSKKLLDHYDIKTPLKSYHAHNEHKILENIISQLSTGTEIALISDAGSPGISDPGFLLVRACAETGIKVTALPGATAMIPALTASGIPSNQFHFEGFLPHKKGRNTRLNYLAELSHTFILYESPFRLIKTLEQLIERCGEERIACVSRELSKIHEEIVTLPLSELHSHFNSKKIKGEIVIIVSGKN